MRGNKIIDPPGLRERAVITPTVSLKRADEEVSSAASEVSDFVVAAQELEHDVEVLVILGSFDIDSPPSFTTMLNPRSFQPQMCDVG